MEKLIQLRKKLNLTQEQMGKMLGVTSGHISKLERGIFKMSDDIIETIQLIERDTDLIDINYIEKNITRKLTKIEKEFLIFINNLKKRG